MQFDFCVACGDTGNLHQHHLVPVVHGGTDDPSNMITLCDACHGRIHGLVWRGHSELVRIGLQRARNRGVVLGRAENFTSAVRKKAQAGVRRRAEKFARSVLPFVSAAKLAGCVSHREIAEFLNSLGIRTSNGSVWRHETVRRVLRYTNQSEQDHTKCNHSFQASAA